jgi:3-oxoacyl-[acyl-carrier protein] reductase
MTLLAKKIVLVTGGSRGIGAGIVREAMREGANVIFTYLNSETEAQKLVEEMSSLFPEQRCDARQCDIADTDAMAGMIKDLINEYSRVDVLVNNAGITRDVAFARMSRMQWDAVIDANLGGLFNATRPLVLQMVKQRAGAIVNMTSAVGVYGNSGQTNYSAAKAGIIGFTKSLSAEIAPFGVRVNAVAPGYIHTDMAAVIDQDRLDYVKSRISLRRMGVVEDVSPLVCFLASDCSGYITGQVIQVDGGITL